MIVLIMNGPAGSGKGTVAECLRKLFKFKVVEYSSINYVKKVAQDQFGWDGVKDTKGRNLLASIKQIMVAYNDLPTKKIVSVINRGAMFDTIILVVDIREPDEIEKLVNYCKEEEIICHTCRVHNTKAEKEAEINGLSLTGDRLYGEYTYDINLDNNGTKEELSMRTLRIFDKLYNEADGHTLDSIGYLLGN